MPSQKRSASPTTITTHTTSSQTNTNSSSLNGPRIKKQQTTLPIPLPTTSSTRSKKQVQKSISSNTTHRLRIRHHPLGIQPYGNYFIDSTTPGFPGSCRGSSLGLLSRLPDEMLMSIIGLLGSKEVLKLSQVSRVLYVLTHLDEVWKSLTIQDFGGDWTWPSASNSNNNNNNNNNKKKKRFYGCWQSTYIRRADYEYFEHQGGKELIINNRKQFRVKFFYSDYLFQSFYCAAIGMEPFTGPEEIEKREKLTVEEFVERFEKPGRPVILTDLMIGEGGGGGGWGAMGKWDSEYFLKNWSEVKLRAEAVDMKLRDYFEYSNAAIDHQGTILAREDSQNQPDLQMIDKEDEEEKGEDEEGEDDGDDDSGQGMMDESPLYLFDKNFGEKCPGILNDMEVPDYFREDLFGTLGSDRRPDYRWLIIGPARSGSTFHKDPNATSAWNAVITGAKKWIMYPPNILPPGVFTNEDESEVTSPVSLMEWFSNFYPIHQALQKERQQERMERAKIMGISLKELESRPEEMIQIPVEGICRKGEIMFVPRGWWHAVVNLEDSIAVTQNYVGSSNLKETMEFLYWKRDQVSGVADERKEGLFEEFKESFLEYFRKQQQKHEEGQTEEERGEDKKKTKKGKEMIELWNRYEIEIRNSDGPTVTGCESGGRGQRKKEKSCSRKPTFWELAKLGALAELKDGGLFQEGEDQVGTVAKQNEESGGGGGFSFGFDFSGDEDDGQVEVDGSM